MVLFRWVLVLIDNYSRMETVVSLRKHLSFFASPWFTPPALVAGFVLLSVWQQIRAHRMQPERTILDSAGIPYVRMDWGWLWASFRFLPLAVLAAAAYAALWLWSFHPPSPKLTYIPPRPPIGWDIPPRRPEVFKAKPSAPIITQQGTGNIAQFGEHSLININPRVNPNAVIITYDCIGNARQVGPGPTAAMEFKSYSGGNIPVLKSMIALNDSQQYAALVEACTKEIESQPQWLTSYLLCSLGYLGLGNIDRAKDMLNHFDDNTGPAYSVGVCKAMSDFLHGRLR